MVMVQLIKVNCSKQQIWLPYGNYHKFSFAKTIFTVWEQLTTEPLLTLITMLEVTPSQDLNVMPKTFF
jgi:hypothetical protein